jgi:hypothetical protein
MPSEFYATTATASLLRSLRVLRVHQARVAESETENFLSDRLIWPYLVKRVDGVPLLQSELRLWTRRPIYQS